MRKRLVVTAALLLLAAPSFAQKFTGEVRGTVEDQSGGATTANIGTIDGADNVDHGSNRIILVYPSVNAIEEFKIQRNNRGAEFGQAGGYGGFLAVGVWKSNNNLPPTWCRSVLKLRNSRMGLIRYDSELLSSTG